MYLLYVVTYLPQTMQYVEALEDVLELRVELVEAGAVHVVAVAAHEGHALRREAVGALVELPHHVTALGMGLGDLL